METHPPTRQQLTEKKLREAKLPLKVKLQHSGVGRIHTTHATIQATDWERNTFEYEYDDPALGKLTNTGFFLDYGVKPYPNGLWNHTNWIEEES